MKANINIPFIGKSGLDMTFEESVDVGSTAGEKSLKSQKWIVKIPSRIPPHSMYVYYKYNLMCLLIFM